MILMYHFSFGSFMMYISLPDGNKSLLGVDLEGHAGMISTIHRKRVGRTLMQDEMSIPIYYTGTQICRELM